MTHKRKPRGELFCSLRHVIMIFPRTVSQKNLLKHSLTPRVVLLTQNMREIEIEMDVIIDGLASEVGCAHCINSARMR